VQFFCAVQRKFCAYKIARRRQSQLSRAVFRWPGPCNVPGAAAMTDLSVAGRMRRNDGAIRNRSANHALQSLMSKPMAACKRT
jgi:hypothetical protein